MEILSYEGTPNHLIIYCQDSNGIRYTMQCHTGQLQIITTEDKTACYSKVSGGKDVACYYTDKNCYIRIPIVPEKDDSVITLWRKKQDDRKRNTRQKRTHNRNK